MQMFIVMLASKTSKFVLYFSEERWQNCPTDLWENPLPKITRTWSTLQEILFFCRIQILISLKHFLVRFHLKIPRLVWKTFFFIRKKTALDIITLREYTSTNFICISWQTLDETRRGDSGFGSTGTTWCNVDNSGYIQNWTV